MVLSIEQIRAKTSKGPNIHLHAMRAWDGAKVAFLELNGLQIHEWDKANMDRSKDDRVIMDTGTGAEHLVKLCMATCEVDAAGVPVSGTGKRVYGDTRAETLEVRQLGGALQEAYMFCLKINRLRRLDDEEAEKNLPPVPSSDTGSTSPTDGAAQ
jgi:hypothetical protein